MKILDRYILKEVVGPFSFGIGIFTILFFAVESMAGVAKIISETDAGLWTVGEYLLCRLPQVLIFTFPMAVLLACLLGFGRISGDLEMTALKAAGVSFMRIATPALIFCFCVSSFAWWLNEKVVPGAMQRAFEILFDSSTEDERILRNLLPPPRRLGNGETQMIYVYRADVKEGSLTGLVIHYFREDQIRREIYAQEARWNGRLWEMKGIRTQEFDEKGQIIYESQSAKGWSELDPELAPPAPGDLKKRKLRPEEMSRSYIAELLETSPAPDPRDEKAVKNWNELRVAYHQKVSLPCASFVFSTFALPLGVRPQRSSRSMGLGLSLAFILIYYVLMSTGLILGENGVWPPMLAAWLPNIVFGTAGLALLWRASRQ